MKRPSLLSLFLFCGLCFSCSASGSGSDGDDLGGGSGGLPDGATGGDSGLGTGGSGLASGGSASGGTIGSTGGANSSTGGTGGADPGGCTPNPGGTTKDLADGTFLDEVTCLTWMKDEWPNSGDLIGRDHAASCDTATVAGHADWRGPDAAEMSSLIANSSNCGTWNKPALWNPLINTTGFIEPVMFWTASKGDDGYEHQCAVNGNTGALEGGSRKNPYHVICVRGSSSITGTATSCTGTACDY